MKIINHDPDRGVASVMSVIGRNPMALKGWSCLVVYCDDAQHHDYDMKAALLWVQPVLKSYLSDVEGHVYCCSNGFMHIICRGVGMDSLAEVASHIIKILSDGDEIKAAYDIYDLGGQGADYIQAVDKARDDSATSIQKVAVFTQTPQYSDMISNLQKSYGDIDLGDAYKPHVLIVDDDNVILWMVENVLAEKTHLHACEDAGQLFTILPKIYPDIIFLDINLPDHDGVSMIDWILERRPDTSIVMFSSKNTLDNIIVSLEKGAKGFIAKPFLKEQLLYYVHQCRTHHV